MKICLLSMQKFRKLHVSQDSVSAFEEALLDSKKIKVSMIYISEIIFKINRKISNEWFHIDDLHTIKEINKCNPDIVFLIAMGVGELKFEIPILKKINTRKAIYCIDTWQSHVDCWERLLKMADVDAVFLSNKASVPVFEKFIRNVFYLPYSMNSKWFYPRENLKKEHLFMQIGRKNESLHQYVLKYINEKGLSDSDYIREKARGQIIYPSFEKLAIEMNKTKFFILAPRNVDESDITGAISDVTARFYEGMACKTLLIGYKPKDTFDTLFPSKNAMIEISGYDDFKNSIDYFLKHEKEYKYVVDNNYDFLIKNHTWKHRADKLIECLNTIL